jgi:arginase
MNQPDPDTLSAAALHSAATLRPIELIAAEIGEGAQDAGCKEGPARLIALGIAGSLAEAGRVVSSGPVIRSDSVTPGGGAAGQMAVVEAFMPPLANAVKAAVERGAFPLVLGGDHSCAIGTWSGVATAMREQGSIGLIWIDAHLDSHTPQTSETQAPHGMPLAALLGHGNPRLTNIDDWSGKLDPRHVVVVGARSHEAGEMALLRSLGVRIMTSGEVRRRGMKTCLNEARQIAAQGTVGYGITFDLDVLDPIEVPAVGSPVTRGPALSVALEALAGLALDARLLAFELVEYNPHLDDVTGSSAAACQSLVLAALTEPATVKMSTSKGNLGG